MTTVSKTYASAFHFRGVAAIPATLNAEQSALFEATKITVKGVEADGFKRKSVPFSISYDVPEGLHAGAVAALESVIHLYAKTFADSYQAVPSVIDWAILQADYLSTAATSAFSAEEKKAALSAIQAFVLALTNREAVANGVAYVLSKGLTLQSLMDAKGFKAKEVQAENVYSQLASLLTAFAEDKAAEAHTGILSVWVDTLGKRLEELAAPEVEINLLG